MMDFATSVSYYVIPRRVSKTGDKFYSFLFFSRKKKELDNKII